MSYGHQLLDLYERDFKLKWLKARRENPEYTESHLVFVYGSFKDDGHNNCVLMGSEYIRDSRTANASYDLVSFKQFPGVVEGEYKIAGEVYRVDGDTLWTMDIIEGQGEFYRREKITVEGVDEPVWIYLLLDRNPEFQEPDCPLICEEGHVKSWSLPTDFPEEN